MPTLLNNQIKLHNNKTLGYAQYGDLQGTPVLYFHGLPSSRYELNIPKCIQIAEQHHVRIIVIDRPGIGLSDFWPYTIAAFPDIITEFGDKLGLDRFAVMGASSGGKYVAACAWKIPQRLTAAAIISGTAPFDIPEVKECLSKQFKFVYGIANAMPWLFILFLKVAVKIVYWNPLKTLSLFGMLSPVDKRVLSQKPVLSAFRQSIENSIYQGAQSGAHDWRIESLPWGFSLQDIHVPVSIHHGEDDWLLSCEHARVLARTIPGAQLKLYSGEGHTLFVNRFEEILRTLI